MDKELAAGPRPGGDPPLNSCPPNPPIDGTGAATDGAGAIEPGTPPLPPPTILIIDDESAFADTLADILGTRGYHTLTASTGGEGTQAARRAPVDLAIVDMKLPDISGVEVLARIRGHSPRTEVIILTGHASLDTAVHCLNLGAFGYLEKPYDIDRLFLLIERALAKRTRKRATGRLASLARLLDGSPVPAFAYSPRQRPGRGREHCLCPAGRTRGRRRERYFGVRAARKERPRGRGRPLDTAQA